MDTTNETTCTGLRQVLYLPALRAAGKAISGGLVLPANLRAEAEDKFHAVNSRNPKDWDRAMNRDD